MSVADDKTVVRQYFNSTGFDRWQRIYGNGEVNRVQRDIRDGHQQTVDRVLEWLQADGNLGGLMVCDAGCGVGSLSIPLGDAGAIVSASDISEKMVAEANQRARNQLITRASNINFMAQDLEKLTGRYHTVICLDVLIHYPQNQAAEMISHLCSLAETRIILSFAPKTLALSILKKIGEFFPGPSKTTRAYQHREADIVKILSDNGFTVSRESMISTSFYFSRLLEAIRC
ncbi:magnesium protoporphyrin IX methyltransferase [Arthrospira platensis]|jgi:magnesium-protoporphyrin O-methyltransferase|uniref:Magnesium protoporphyrin IX methyltransferase n=1 Tax=Limnospira platensis NIES-46 TaxID=1236695 RepID=A0A5M3TBI8_LIMPL|nr:magnesium protoporphyrin IX methyltransferase [Arthrospira platensis]AMW31009.1 Mg-protoporphyrin IX methyl transferase [Arthrospira platensis YZ]KDR54781.1 Mg-protoporphyrin IX methyl transferase [Arthrospira platensis str. Paraca]MBD2669574.1 magnesium protoporphyrin IX methyltransferase [Arthrospira platensis FACHB-439]MBD2711112.1 magnesium protoporphyrin IX methyltransferase [Arthrospira platensis FACHB-835]MDF2208384.1 magnesium protoporphyrin IX methyltransferase [Arthrospira platens